MTEELTLNASTSCPSLRSTSPSRPSSRRALPLLRACLASSLCHAALLALLIALSPLFAVKLPPPVVKQDGPICEVPLYEAPPPPPVIHLQTRFQGLEAERPRLALVSPDTSATVAACVDDMASAVPRPEYNAEFHEQPLPLDRRPLPSGGGGGDSSGGGDDTSGPNGFLDQASLDLIHSSVTVIGAGGWRTGRGGHGRRGSLSGAGTGGGEGSGGGSGKAQSAGAGPGSEGGSGGGKEGGTGSPSGPSAERPARPLQTKPGPYPYLARKAGLEGTVRLRLEIQKDGKVGEVRVLSSSGHESLDQAARETARRWRFEPAQGSGGPMVSWFEIAYRFVLRDGGV